ncbi:MAG: T9SS type A sorting domain-containing protein [Bacteroidota bacterium]
MKQLFWILTLCLLQSPLWACSFSPDSFCQTINQFSDYHILAGTIIAADETGIDFEILEVVRGTEDRAVVRIWDGTDFDCNGPWSMAANEIGAVGESYVLILPLIEELENTWDVLGDYRRLHPYAYETDLYLEDGIAYGLVEGFAIAPPEMNIQQVALQTLIDELAESGDCSGFVSTTAVSKETNILVPNPFSETLQVQFGGDYAEMQVRVYSITGQVLHSSVLLANDLLELPTQHWQAGLYVLELVAENRLVERKKLIKQ